MKERPILFSGPMVRAILEGRKTMTRRVVKPQPGEQSIANSLFYPAGMPVGMIETLDGQTIRRWFCPYGQPGDRLWVRETWRPSLGHFGHTVQFKDGEYLPRPDDAKQGWIEEHAENRNEERWRPSIHMPRWASRITLEVTEVRVERLQDITHEDALREGFTKVEGKTWGRLGFSQLWDHLNAARGYGWDSNPWVWVVSFRRVS